MKVNKVRNQATHMRVSTDLSSTIVYDGTVQSQLHQYEKVSFCLLKS